MIKEELKTLKDLCQPEYMDKVESLLALANVQDVIRQEAVKWVKAKRYKHPSLDGVSDEIKDEAVINFIKYFFNLTEKDLKGENYL